MIELLLNCLQILFLRYYYRG